MRPGRTHPDPTNRHAGEDIIVWRTRRLTAAGFDPQIAASLASDRRFDLHAMLELVDRGCPPDLAVRILAPLDWVDRRHVQ